MARERDAWIRCGRRCRVGLYTPRPAVIAYWWEVTLPGLVIVGTGQECLTRQDAERAANACAIQHYRANTLGPWTGAPGQRPVS